MPTTAKNLPSQLNLSNMGALVNALKGNSAALSNELIKVFEGINTNNLAHLFQEISDQCSNFSVFSLFLQVLMKSPRDNFNFCANDLVVLTCAIANKLKLDHGASLAIEEENKQIALNAIRYLLEGYGNTCHIDMLYQVDQSRALRPGSLNVFDSLFAEHLTRDNCKENTIKQNLHYYSDIFIRHHLPHSFAFYLDAVSDNYEKTEVLFNTLSHSEGFSSDYAKVVHKQWGKDFLIDISYEEIHEHGNVDTYLSVCSAVGEEAVLNRELLLKQLKEEKSPELLKAVMSRTYLSADNMPQLINFVLDNFGSLLKLNVKANANALLWRAQEHNKLILLWDHIIDAMKSLISEEFYPACSEDVAVQELFKYFNLNSSQADNLHVWYSYFAEDILRRLSPKDYPEIVFSINDENYSKLRKSVGPVLDRDEGVRMKFVNAKREILSEDLGL